METVSDGPSRKRAPSLFGSQSRRKLFPFLYLPVHPFAAIDVVVAEQEDG